MTNKLKIVEVTSELGAGTRGASTGVGAIRTAAYNSGSTFFKENPFSVVPNFNEYIFRDTDTPGAIRIEYIEKQFELIIDEIKNTLSNHEFPFVLAGDHSTAAATIAGIQQTYPEKKMGVIWVDAHGDLHSPYTSPSGNVHGMPLAIACGIDNKECSVREINAKTYKYWEKLKEMSSNNLHPDNLVFVGVRDTEEPEDVLMEKLSIKNFLVEEVKQEGGEMIAKKTLDILQGCDMLYVSFDVDSMDPDETSYGTGTPVKNGIPVKEVMAFFEEICKSPKLVCFETVEVNPTLDNKKNAMAEVTISIIDKVSKTIFNRK